MIISKIIEIESKSKIDFEYVHVNTKNVEDNNSMNKGLHVVSDYNKLAKEERIKHMSEDRRVNRGVSGNAVLNAEDKL